MPISIIIPTLNEARELPALTSRLEPLRRRGCELILVDGGSTDGTPELARPHVDRVVGAPRGRAAQMNAGAGQAAGGVFVFLHADTRLPEGADEMILGGLARTGRAWGRFDVLIDGTHPILKLVGSMMNLRSRLSGIATGDQTIFMTREAYARVGGFPELALMEDVAISRALKHVSRPVCISQRAVTSGRRWQARGIYRTIGLMWMLRLAYFLGVPPERLARVYAGK